MKGDPLLSDTKGKEDTSHRRDVQGTTSISDDILVCVGERGEGERGRERERRERKREREEGERERRGEEGERERGRERGERERGERRGERE